MLNTKQKIGTLLATTIALLAFVCLCTYWLADYYYAKEDYKKAISLAPWEPLFKADYALSIARGKNQDKVSEALALLAEASKEAPRDVKLLKTASLAYSDLSELYQSLLGRETETLLKLTILAPSDPWITYQLALSYLKQGQRDLAVEYLKKTLTLKPNYEKAQDILTRFGILHI